MKLSNYQIYYLVKNDIIFYVGLTINPDGRLLTHKVTHGRDVKMVVIDQVYQATLKEARGFEDEQIKLYLKAGNPLINKNGVRLKSDLKQTFTYRAKESIILSVKRKLEGTGISLSQFAAGIVKHIASDSKIPFLRAIKNNDGSLNKEYFK